MATKTLGGAGGVLPLPEKALGESLEKGGRKMQGRATDTGAELILTILNI